MRLYIQRTDYESPLPLITTKVLLAQPTQFVKFQHCEGFGPELNNFSLRYDHLNWISLLYVFS